MERRLAAIIAADVVGYSRLIRSDEEGTLAALKALRGDLINPKIAEHHGRVVKLMGDGMLAEFASVVDAVRAAAEMQQAVAERNSALPKEERIEFRVGINLGDVVIDGDDIHGDGVNVAARLEGLAAPGGICISEAAYEQVRDRTSLTFENLGHRELKNIDRPVRVWCWPPYRDAAADDTESAEKPLLRPDKPSIAVLPFNNMSGDPEQEYFSDGITEDIITALSKYPWFFVIARATTFVFKGQALDVAKVGKQLGARYLVEGSVRRSANRVRVTAQLIDASSGNHLWAEKYDRDLADIFVVQDEITRAIIGELTPEFMTAEVRRARRKTDAELDAWDLVMRGREHLWRINRESNRRAQRYFGEAIERATGGGLGRADLALALYLQLVFGWAEDRARTIEQMGELSAQAIAADANDAYALVVASFAKLYTHDVAAAIEFGRKSIAANPNLAIAHTALGHAFVFSGQYEKGVESLNLSLRLSPRDPLMALGLIVLGLGHYLLKRYEIAERTGRRVTLEQPNMPGGYRLLEASLAQLGRLDEARSVVADHILRLIPGHTAGQAGEQLPFGDNRDARRHFLEGLVKAGLPE